MRQGRPWLPLLYALATLLAQGAHDHGPGSHAAKSVPNIACDDAALHVEAHPPQGHGHDPDPCPACQFRTQNLAWQAAAPVALVDSVELAPEPSAPTFRSVSILRPTGRAPPHA